jgi:carboxypeptidase Q
VAALVRSVTPYSLYTPHTGGVNYSGKQTRIPAAGRATPTPLSIGTLRHVWLTPSSLCAAVTVEDSEMMSRMHKRGQTVRVTLQMDAQILGYNVALASHVFRTTHDMYAYIRASGFTNPRVGPGLLA